METSQGSATKLMLRPSDQQFEGVDSQKADALESPTKDAITRSEGKKGKGSIVQLDRQDATTWCQIGRKVAEGSFGVVFAGTWLSDQKEVAIKFVSISCTETRSKH
jgi:hypothetical protein